jgi:hypothetical protein
VRIVRAGILRLDSRYGGNRKASRIAREGWLLFRCGDQQLHIGVERDCRPAKKAHPAFAVADLDGLRAAFVAQGIAVVDDPELPGTRRFYAEDPWGNRLEFIESIE